MLIDKGRRYQCCHYHIPESPLRFSMSVLKFAAHNEAVNPLHRPVHIYQKLGDSMLLNGIQRRPSPP
jgi:hypothetical protein